MTQLEVHSLVEVVATPHFGPQCPILLHLEQWESHAGQFVLLAGCCHVQLGQSLEGADGV